jgi:hypothetical protein
MSSLYRLLFSRLVYAARMQMVQNQQATVYKKGMSLARARCSFVVGTDGVSVPPRPGVRSGTEND